MERRQRLEPPTPGLARIAVHLLALALTAAAAGSAVAQTPALTFANAVGSTDANVGDHGRAIAIDAFNNQYVTGSFKGSVDFDPGAGVAILTSVPDPGAGDIFVASYDASGNYRWAFSVGGPPTAGMLADNTGLSIAVDGSGNVVVSGLFLGTMDFDPGVGITNLASNGWSTFVAKYSPTGNFLWAFKLGPYSGQNDIAIDASGNVVVVGTFKYTVDFDPGPGTAALTSVKAGPKNRYGDQSDIFVAKYSANGAYLWAFRLGNDYRETADAVDVDGSGNIYLTGSFGDFSTTVDFNPTKQTANLTGPATYVAKYTGGGAYVWAFKLGTSSTADGQRIDVDASGNIALTGNFTGTVDLDPGAGTANLTGRSANGTYDFFVARYSAAGGYQWAFSPSVGNALAVTIDGNGDVFVAGEFRGSNDFDPGSGTVDLDRDAVHDRGGFAASYTSAGVYRWAFSVPTVATYVRGIASSGNGDVHLTGSLRFAADFDPSESAAIVAPVGNYDIFVAKYTEVTMGKRSAPRSAEGPEIVAAPNPFAGETIVRVAMGGETARVEVLDLMGRRIEYYQDVDPAVGLTFGSRLPAGTYLVRFTQGDTRRETLVHKLR